MKNENLLEKLSNQQSVAQHFACLHNSHNRSINLSNPRVIQNQILFNNMPPLQHTYNDQPLYGCIIQDHKYLKLLELRQV